jgi:2-methylisocitrate lyase-like PEP mutase family enzyme
VTARSVPASPPADQEANVGQTDKARYFADLHVKGTPLLLYNAWDAGSAKAIRDAGAKAIATSSWSVAEAQGYHDGETIPITFVERIVGQIAATIDLPVTVDFEGGYNGDDDDALAGNVARLLDLGVVGINFEDRVVKGSGLYDIRRQAERIAAVRATAEERGVALFINARTDLFLGQDQDEARSVGAALDRAKAYAAAGASGFFIPGLTAESLIGRICDDAPLPVNVMVIDGVPSNDRLTALGVARISYGPIPYVRAMSLLGAEAKMVLSSDQT